MLEQLISDLIVALQNNTAAIKSASNLTVTTSPGVTLTTVVENQPTAANPEPDKKKVGRPAKSAEAPKADTPPPVSEKKSVTLEDVRDLGTLIVETTGETAVIRNYVLSVLPDAKPAALRFLRPDQLDAAHEFLSKHIATIDQKIVADYLAKKQKAA